MRKLLFILTFGFAQLVLFAHDSLYVKRENINYYDEAINRSDEYIRQSCVLDIYYPKCIKKISTIVWFHGGGLIEGEKYIPEQLKDKGYCIIAVNYRLNPKVKCPAYIEDAAAAVAWVFKNINSYGGATNQIFISGHSAGGYLAAMIGLDKEWLGKYNIDANRIAGVVPFNGQMITHFTIRKERGIPETQGLIDKFASIYYVRKDAPPLILITGDREMEILGRYEENAYLMRMMKVVGHNKTELYELGGYCHNMTEPAFPILINCLEEIRKTKKSNVRND